MANADRNNLHRSGLEDKRQQREEQPKVPGASRQSRRHFSRNARDQRSESPGKDAEAYERRHPDRVRSDDT